MCYLTGYECSCSYYNHQIFDKPQRYGLTFIFFWNEKIRRLFLFTLTVFPNQLTLKASSVYRRALWLASSLSVSPSSSVHVIGLASEQMEMSKEDRPGNQRGDYSQTIEQRGFRYGLCCHRSKEGKVSKTGTLANLIFFDWKLRRSHQVSGV